MRRIFRIRCTVLACVLLYASTLFALPKNKIVITEATIDQVINRITIHGINFFGNGDNGDNRAQLPSVLLQTTVLPIVSETSTQIVAVIPPGLTPGMYLLTVSAGSENYDTFDLAIGAMGPTGATGPAGPTGVTGTAGPKGAVGPTGAAGPTGAVGPTGAAGSTGAVGPTGAAGPAGAIGPTGPVGSVGAMGPTGPVGSVGAMGPTGPVGSVGAMGPTGPVGSVGAIGPTGPAGSPGAMGPTGPVGSVGAMGPTGPAGSPGAIGPTGPAGLAGAIGPTGPAGLAGAIGPTGPAGLAGAIGPTGPAGLAGAIGPTGPAGLAGAIGPTGPAGLAGAIGPTGPAGSVGTQGETGAQGAVGPTGPIGPAGPAGATGATGATGSAATVGPGTTAKVPVFTSSNTISNSSISDDGSVVQTPLQLRVPILYDRDNTNYFIDPASTSNTNVLRFNNVDCINNMCPTNTAVRMTPNFHFNSGPGSAVIVNWDNGTTGSTQTFRIGNGNGSDVFYVYADGQAFTTNWWRSLGATGWYNESYGGGFYMYDYNWIRLFPEDNSHHMYFNGGFDTLNPAGVGCGGGLGGGYTFHVCGSMAANSYATLSDERRKKDVHDLDAREMRHALDGLDGIRSVRFRYKDETENLDPENPSKWQPEPHIGVIAQSVPKELLTPDPTGKADLSVSLADTLGYTIAAVRGLRSETKETVEHLKNQLAERDQQIADLTARLAALEAALKNSSSDR